MREWITSIQFSSWIWLALWGDPGFQTSPGEESVLPLGPQHSATSLWQCWTQCSGCIRYPPCSYPMPYDQQKFSSVIFGYSAPWTSHSLWSPCPFQNCPVSWNPPSHPQSFDIQLLFLNSFMAFFPSAPWTFWCGMVSCPVLVVNVFDVLCHIIWHPVLSVQDTSSGVLQQFSPAVQYIGAWHCVLYCHGCNNAS